MFLRIIAILFFFAIANTANAQLETVKTKKLAKGVTYKNFYMKKGKKKKLSTHVVEFDLNKSDASLEVIKPYLRANGRDRLHSYIPIYDSLNNTETLVAINGSFWQGGTNYPIGPTVLKGELVTMNKYKNWSAAMFEFDEMEIDNFTFDVHISGIENTEPIIVSQLNKRTDTSQIVMYNKYFGDSLGEISTSEILKQVKETIAEAKVNIAMAEDSTENFSEQDSIKLYEETFNVYKKLNREFSSKKYIFEYIDDPSINEPIRIKFVKTVEFGHVAIPKKGFVITGDLSSFEQSIIKSKKLFLETQTVPQSASKFDFGLSGIPRLVRNGIAKHEAANEGSKSKRFINGELPRTAIGTNRNKSKFYLVTVEATQKSKRIFGATLDNMAKLMKAIGCYNAMNLDGGGSSAMFIEGANVNIPSRPDFSRKLSVMLGIVLKRK